MALTILEKYRFYLTLPTGEVRVYPDNPTLDWVDEENEDWGFWRKLLDTELVFTDNAHNTFTELSSIEESQLMCYKTLLRVERFNGATWVTCWNGYLPFRKGKWSYSTKSVYIKPRPEDIYTCLLDNVEQEVNVLEVEGRLTLQTIEGTIAYTGYLSISGGLVQYDDRRLLTLAYAQQQAAEYAANNLGPNWVLFDWRYEIRADINGAEDWELIVRYAREESVAVPVNPNNWVLDGSTYTRVPPLSDTPVQSGNALSNPTSNEYTVELMGSYAIVDFTADNAVLLSDALDYLFSQTCGTQIVSNFFGVNATGSNPDNEEYTEAVVDFAKVAMFQASDLIYAGQGEPATVLNISVERLLGGLAKKFPLVLFYDTAISKFRLEHISWVSRNRMLNMEARAEDRAMLAGNREYEYSSNDFPFKELWNDQFATGVDFTDAVIEYNRACATDRKSEKEQKYDAELIFDLKAVYQNEELIEDKDIRTAPVLVALNNDNSVKAGTGAITGRSGVLNHVFASGNIIGKYWMADRPLKSGKVNGVERVFKGTKPVREQNELQTTLTDADYWDTFDPLDMVRTQFGWGRYSEEVVFEEPHRQLIFKPKFSI